MRQIEKSLRAVFIIAAVIMIPAALAHAVCTPLSSRLCVAADDTATVYVNDTFVGTFNYVNWDEDGVYPTCIDLPAGLVVAGENYVALDVRNDECCEIWGSWSIETLCAEGTHSCISSDDDPMHLYNVPTPSETPPADDINGLHWWNTEYIEEPGLWNSAVRDTGTIYGKLIYNPCTGALLQPLSYDAGGEAELPGSHIYMRQGFNPEVTPVPTLPPPNFTITKTIIGATTGIVTNQRVTYSLHVCNTGQAEPGEVVITDDYDDGFDFGGPYYGDCGGYGDGSPCYSGGGGFFYVKWLRGFAGNTCVDVSATVIDYWLDSSEYCDTRLNWAGVHWPTGDFTPNITPDARSNTVSVTMYCPTDTFTRTVTPVVNTPTFTPTFTVTVTITPSRTRTPIFTWTQTNSFTYSPTFTQTFTITNSYTFTRTRTITPTWSITRTHTPHPSGTETYTPTVTNTSSYTFTPTFTYSRTRTNTPTFTITRTWTFSPTFTRTTTLTLTLTISSTPTYTVTPTWVNAITLTKSESTQIAQLGDTVQYCISFTNVGSNAADFQIWDTIPGPMDFLFCSTESDGTACDGPTTDAGWPKSCVEYVNGASSGDCRVIKWDMVNVPPGATGQVCFWVLVARLQTTDKLSPAKQFFADVRSWFGKIADRQDTGQKNTENLRNIRGPDKTD